MIRNDELEKMLLLYDNFHYDNNEIVRMNIDINSNFVIVTLEKNKSEYFKFLLDDDFKNIILPKITLHFFSLNDKLKYRKLMANDRGNIIFQNDKEELIIRNIDIDAMEKIIRIKDCLDNLREGKEANSEYENYLKINISIDYAKYRKDFYDLTGRLNFFDKRFYRTYLESDNREDDKRDENFIILDIARCLYALQDEDKYEVIKEQYKNDYIVVKHIQNFENAPFTSIYGKALLCAEFEMRNENIFINNKNLVLEIMNYVKDDSRLSFNDYFDGRRRFYKVFENKELEHICDIIVNSNITGESVNVEDDHIPHTNTMNGFKEIINNPLEEEKEMLFDDYEHEALAKAGEEQAKLIMKIIKEKDDIKKDAEEFAKIILKKQKEYREIVKAAEEQAKKIITLERENSKLKTLAEENAMNIFLRDKKREEEMYLRDIKDETPISNSDIDKINNLLNAISSVKDLDFVLNHPTVASEVYVLEEKIVTYLSTHKNIKKEDKVKEEFVTEKEELKTPIELLSIIRNVYFASHEYEKDGRHTVINVSPHFDKYRVVVYSVKDDNDDILTDVYFDKIFFNEDVIKELCDIYSKNAKIIASKTDNIPDDLADFLVIDNMDNALKFTGCKRYIIQIAKAYL